MGAKKIAGYGILILFGLGFFALAAAQVGLLGAVFVFTGTAVAASLLYLAIWLIVES